MTTEIDHRPDYTANLGTILYRAEEIGCEQIVDLSELETLSDAYLALSGEQPDGCDGCDRELSNEVLGHAGVSWVVAFDSDGAPDVSICPFCVEEDRNREPQDWG
jgi:hypothetical protein